MSRIASLPTSGNARLIDAQTQKLEVGNPTVHLCSQMGSGSKWWLAHRGKKQQVRTCVEFKLGSVGAGVALQRGAVVQAQDGLARALLSLLGFGERIGTHQTDGFETLGDHDEFHPLPGQSDQALLQSHEGRNPVVL